MKTIEAKPFKNALRLSVVVWAVVLSVWASVAGVGCASFSRKPDAEFESARVKLMEGTITRDQSVIEPLLAPDFAWREDVAPSDEEPFDYWNRHNLWAELQGLLKEQPVRRSGMLVVPRGAWRESYQGPRLAWRKVGAEWRLAYYFSGVGP